MMRPRSPGVARWIVRRSLPRGTVGASILGDLENEFRARALADRRAATRWFRSQAVSVAARAWRDRLLGRPWGGRRAGVKRGGAGGGLGRDVRYGLRVLRREPGFAVTVIVTFGLAVGANVAVFSVLNSILLRALPYPASDRLVEVHREVGAVSYPDFVDWQRDATAFDAFAAYQLTRETHVADGLAEEWIGLEGSADLLRVLGVSPLIGTGFSPGPDDFGSHGIVLGHALWMGRFGGDPGVLGQTITFEDRTVTVIGVMPPGFYFPTPREQFWATLSDNGFMDNRGAWFLRTVGRLAPGVTPEGAEREVALIATRVDREHPDNNDAEDRAIRVQRRQEAYVGDTRPLMLLLIGSVSLVLAIACANLASLALTRGFRRRREFALRAALGASRPQIVRQVLVENLLLALAGGGLGVVLAAVLVRALVALGPSDLPRLTEIGIHGSALAYALAVTIGCGLLVGSAPAWRGRNTGASVALRESARGTAARQQHRLLGTLLIGQLALTSVLLVGAGLLLNSFKQLVSVQPGFDVEHTLSLSVDLPRGSYGSPALVRRYHADVTARLETLPGVRAIGFSSGLPFTSSYTSASYQVEGEPADAGSDMYIEVVTENYPSALGLPVVRGRGFDATDRPDVPLVAIINQDMADRHWPGEDPIGHRFTWEPDDPKWITVIGVVPDVLRRGLHDTPSPMAYLSLDQFHGHYDFMSGRHGNLAVRTAGDPAALADMAVRAIRSVDPRVPISDVRTMQEMVDDSVDQPRFRATLLGAFAGLAMIVSLVGIYGVVAFAVAQRRREFGIRMALGAPGRRIVTEVVMRGAWLIGIGLALGLTGAAAATRVMATMLFGVTPTDPVTFGAVLLLMGGVGLLASALPARRASRVDPVVTLKEQ